ncbi:MAG: hypothetical protein J7L39_00810 [Candidatus Aenigmarchaeota archaeon]|nr:hypothetical protein [Candidatus Aenigmarchaeota archaeon]
MILGICDETHNSSVCLIDDGKIKFAASEERFSRKKHQGGFPKKAIEYLNNNFELKNVRLISVGGTFQPLPYRIFLSLHRKNITPIASDVSMTSFFKDFIRWVFKSKIYTNNISKHFIVSFSKIIIRHRLPEVLKDKPIFFVDHHIAHAASACFFSGFKRCLCITADGEGDGYSLTVNLFNKGKIQKIHGESSLNSLGLFFSYVTQFLGFRAFDHEGKIMGLASYGNCNNVDIPFPFNVENGRIIPKFKMGMQCLLFLKKYLSNFRKEDIAAWLQHNLEETILKLINFWMEKTGERKLALSGGVFANVKLNKKIRELDTVKEVFVFPAMGDEGLSVGAAVYAYYKFKRKFKPLKIRNVFFGPKFSDYEVKNLLEKYRLKWKRIRSMREIARLIVKGEIIPIFYGRMEFGPRALGNRSVIMDPRRIDKKDILNLKLKKRDWFMPFAPTIMKKYAKKYLKFDSKSLLSSKFMTMVYDCTKEGISDLRAAIHVDKTCRPQILEKKDNPKFYEIIKEFERLSGIGAVLNTSFNIHGEPIVCSPEDAIKTFIRSKFKYMVIEDYLVRRW